MIKKYFVKLRKYWISTFYLAILKKYKNTNSIFRGLSYALFKNLSSFNRFYLDNFTKKSIFRFPYEIIRLQLKSLLTKDLNHLLDLFQKLMHPITNSNDIIKNQIKYFNILFALFLNSYLQHQRGITKYLDFTKNIEKALFFSFFDREEIKKQNELNDYVSLYIITHPIEKKIIDFDENNVIDSLVSLPMNI